MPPLYNLQKISSLHSFEIPNPIDWSKLQTHKSSYWFQIEDIWYHKSVIRVADIMAADIIITKDSDGVFRYTKHRGQYDTNTSLNEEELKEIDEDLTRRLKRFPDNASRYRF